jgi:hypothetical protein
VETLTYYADQSLITDPGETRSSLGELPRDLEGLQRIASGLVLHYRSDEFAAIMDPLDVPRDRFLVAGEAWQACRNNEADPETFLVDPGLDIPQTRGWPYLSHNLVHDLAANRDCVVPGEVISFSPVSTEPLKVHIRSAEPRS